jgi:hypothetical protein
VSRIIAQALATGRRSLRRLPCPTTLQHAQARLRTSRRSSARSSGPRRRGILYLQGQRGDGFFPRRLDDRRDPRPPPGSLADLVLARHRERSGADATRAARQRPGWRADRAQRGARGGAGRWLWSDVSVLLTGDNGTGRTNSRVIHDNTPAALRSVSQLGDSENLTRANSSLGRSQGGIRRRRKVGGKVAAEHGTLLLDEVGDRPLAAQAKLLGFFTARYLPRRHASVRATCGSSPQQRRPPTRVAGASLGRTCTTACMVPLGCRRSRSGPRTSRCSRRASAPTRAAGAGSCSMRSGSARRARGRRMARERAPAGSRSGGGHPGLGASARQLGLPHLFPNGRAAATPGGADGDAPGGAPARGGVMRRALRRTGERRRTAKRLMLRARGSTAH